MPRYLIITPDDSVRSTDDSVLADEAVEAGIDIVIDTQELVARYGGETQKITPITYEEWADDHE